MYSQIKTQFYFFLIFIITLAANSSAWRDAEMEIRLNNLSSKQLIILHGLHLNGDVWPKGATVNARFFVTPDELNKIKEVNIPYEITISDMKEHYKNFWSDQEKLHHSATAIVPSGYHTTDQIIVFIDSLVKTNPAICSKISLGQTANKKQLCMLKISKYVSQHENESQICFDGGIHGNEIGGPENLILFAKELCSKYGSDTTITRLIDSREIFLFCMVNPDGRDKMIRENTDGIDLNRDEGYMWGGEEGSKSPFSQPETKAIRSAILSNQFVITTSYHSGTEAVYYPWGWSSANPPDQSYHKSLTAAYISSSGYSSNIQSCSSNADYETKGETIDYSYGVMGTASQTVELSEEMQPSDIAGFYNKNVSAMLKMIEMAGYGLEGVVSDSISNAPVSAVLYVNNSFPFYSNPILGDYHKFITAGTYNIKVVANGYKSKTINNITIQDGISTITDIKLERDINAIKCYGYKIICLDGATGNTDSLLNAADNKTCVIKGTQGAIIDMQYPVQNTAESNITVRVSGTTTSYNCSAGQSPDGPWCLLGTGRTTDSFTVSKCALQNCQYVNIQSTNCGIDAVEGTWNYDYPSDVQKSIAVNSNVNPILISQMNGRLNIYNDNESTLKFSIFTLQGKCCITSQIPKGNCIWRLLTNGIYIVRVLSSSKKLTEKRIRF